MLSKSELCKEREWGWWRTQECESGITQESIYIKGRVREGVEEGER